jgi:uncharacterized OB-fold protein
MVCKSCRQNEHNEFEPVPLPNTGKLLTFTKLYNLPGDYEVPHLTLGIVELENGLSITGQLRVEEPRIGMAVTGEVQVVRTEAYDQRYGMVFYEA